MKGYFIKVVHKLKVEEKTGQKIFANWICYLAIIFLVLSMSVFGLTLVTEVNNADENSNVFTKISKILNNKDVISEDMKMDIEKLIENTDHISKIQIYNVKNIEKQSEDYTSVFEYVEKAIPHYQYEKTLWASKWLLTDFSSYGNGDAEWYINMEIRNILSFGITTLFIGVVVCMALFIIRIILYKYRIRKSYATNLLEKN